MLTWQPCVHAPVLLAHVDASGKALFGLTLSATSLQVGMPERPVWPCGHDLGLLAGVALTSFFGQYTLNRSFQLLAASHASAVNTLQVLIPFPVLLSLLCF